MNTFLLQILAHLDGIHHLNVTEEGAAWKIMLPDWLKGMQITDTQDPGLGISDSPSGDALVWHPAPQLCPLSSG